MLVASSEIKLSAADFSPRQSGKIGEHVSLESLRASVQRAIALNGSVTISIQPSENNEGASSEILQNLERILTSASSQLWSTLTGNTLTLTNETPCLSFRDIDEALQERAQNICSTDLLTMASPEVWGEHLKAVQAHIRDELRNTNTNRKSNQKIHKLDPATNERRIRGCVGELVLQQMLTDAFASRQKSSDTMLLDRKSRFAVPDGLSGRYSLRFTTRLNCEIKFHQSIGNSHASHRNKPLQDSQGTLTEVDAAIAAGMDPTGKHCSRLFLFDTTTSDEQFRGKMLKKPTQLQEFIYSMEDRGIDVQIVIVELASPDIPLKMMPPRTREGHVNGVILRPGNIVDVLTRKSAQELSLEIPQHT